MPTYLVMADKPPAGCTEYDELLVGFTIGDLAEAYDFTLRDEETEPCWKDLPPEVRERIIRAASELGVSDNQLWLAVEEGV